MTPEASDIQPPLAPFAPRSGVWADRAFWIGLALISASYVALLLAMLAADAFFTAPRHLLEALSSPEIRYATILSMISCTVTGILSVWVAIPFGYLMSRWEHPWKALIDAIVDIPIVLPPLVVGLSLLILFQTPAGRWVESFVPVTYEIPSVILAQFSVACAFSIRSMRGTFDQISPRAEQVAMTLGCSRASAFWRVGLPQAWRGVIAAFTLAWARSLGEFGPILVFSGATRFKTEVLPTTVFLELSVGRLDAAVAVSLLMVGTAVIVLVTTRVLGSKVF